MKRKALSLAAVAGFVLLAFSLVSIAQPVTSGGGLSRVTTTGGGLAGSGTTTAPLKLRSDCSDGQVLKSTSGAWGCAADGTGSISDGDKGDITVSSSGTVWNLDDVSIGSQPGAGTANWMTGAWQTNNVMMSIQSTPTAKTDETSLLWLVDNGTYDTTSGNGTTRGVEISLTGTRSSGSNPLTNYGVTVSVTGGQENYSWHSTNGTMRQDGPTLFGDRNTFGSGAQAASGETKLYTDFTVDSAKAVSLGNNVANFQVPTGRILLGNTASLGQIQTSNVGVAGESIIGHFANTSVSGSAYAGNRMWRGTSVSTPNLRAGVNVGSGGGQFANGDTANALVLWSYDSGGSSYGIELATGSNPDVRVRVKPDGQTDVLAGLSVTGALKGTNISPSAITGTNNDWNPTGLSTATEIRINTSGTATITGIQGGSAGRILILRNIGAHDVTIANEAGGSTAANRITGNSGANWILTASRLDSITLVYSGAASRWEIIASSTLPQLSVTGNTTLGTNNVDTVTIPGDLFVQDTAEFQAGARLGDAEADINRLNGKLYATGTAPSLSSCGTSPSITGNDKVGKFTTGTASPSACTLTFNNAWSTNAPICIVQRNNASSSLTPKVTADVSAVSTSAFTVSFIDSSTGLGANCQSCEVNYQCIGRL